MARVLTLGHVSFPVPRIVRGAKVARLINLWNRDGHLPLLSLGELTELERLWLAKVLDTYERTLPAPELAPPEQAHG